MNTERNFDEVIDRRGTCSYKWYKEEHGLGDDDIIPIWTADMDFRCAKPIVDAVVERAQHGLFGYALRDQAHKDCVLNWQTKRYGTTPNEEWMAYAPPGVLFAINLVVEILTKKGDNILVIMPNYDPLYEVVTKSERNLVESELLIGEDGSVKIDFDDLDKKLAQDVKILIMSNPHNPSGRVWTKEELQGIADLAAKHNVFVISDEIHADLVAKDKHHITYYSLGDDVAKNSMCCYSANKGFNLGGFQTSTLVIGDQDLKAEFNKRLSIAQTTTDNLFGAVATKAAYTDPECEAWLDDVIEYIDDNKELLYSFVEKNIPQLKVIPSEGTYLAWVDCSGLGYKDGKELEDFFMNKAKVEPCMGYEFGKQGELFVRLNLACPKSTLEKVLNRIKNAIEK